MTDKRIIPMPESSGPAALKQVHERHQWAQPGDEPDRTFILKFSDPDCRDQYFTGKDAEQRAIEAWNLYSPNWNVYLFGTMPMADTPASSDLIRELMEALENAKGLIDTPIGRRSLGDGEFYGDVVSSVNTALDKARAYMEGR